MTPRQQAFALIGSAALLIFIVEMVRRRRLREEYSWLWIIVGVAILALTAWFGLLEWLTRLIGAVVPVSTFFVFGILFLVVVNIYSTIKISTLATQVKNLAQRLAIVDAYVQELREAGTPPPDAPSPAGTLTPAEGRAGAAEGGSAPPPTWGRTGGGDQES